MQSKTSCWHSQMSQVSKYRRPNSLLKMVSSASSQFSQCARTFTVGGISWLFVSYCCYLIVWTMLAFAVARSADASKREACVLLIVCTCIGFCRGAPGREMKQLFLRFVLLSTKRCNSLENQQLLLNHVHDFEFTTKCVLFLSLLRTSDHSYTG